MKINDDYKNGYREGFLDGFKAAKDNPYMTQPVVPNTFMHPTITTACKVCGINFGSGPMGYVCNHINCPTKITC